MNPAPNLVMVGPMGAGKSCIGRRIAERFSLQFVDVDQAIVEHAGASISAIFDNGGEAVFRRYECEVLARIMQGCGQLVSTGGGAILAEQNRQLLQQRGFVIHLAVSVQSQLLRLARDRTRPLLQRPDREQVLQQLAATRLPLYQQVADLTLDTNQLTANQATAQLVLQLAAQWRPTSTDV